jgi:hypothetical protein
MRTKAKQIVGNLYRSDTGKFQAGSGGGPAGATPKRGIVLSRQPKPSARPKPAAAAAKPKKGGGGKGPKPKDPAVLARQAQRDQEHVQDRQQRQADREARLARQAQRDAEHTQDRQARLHKQPPGARTRQQDAVGALVGTPKPKPAKAAPGGGSSKKPSADDKRRERSQAALDTAGEVGISPADLGALRDSAEMGGVKSPALATLGLIGPDGQATDQGRRALSALEHGNVRQYRAALQDATARMGREAAAGQRAQQATGRRAQAASDRAKRQQQKLDRLKRLNVAGRKLTQSQLDQATEAGLLGSDGRWKSAGGALTASKSAVPAPVFASRVSENRSDPSNSLLQTPAARALPSDQYTPSFTVFKDHRGQQRWIARTTTAYRDRDGEIISAAALDADSQRMMATKQFGPLRYWHIGEPDPLDVTAPWGPGLDIGDCDYSALIGRTRLESGTFRDPHIAQQVARQADGYELSPGFFHPLDQPGPHGVFSAIRTFERSIVPVKHGRASNLFTGLAVKEHRMDIQEMEKRFKAAIADLGLDAQQAEALGAQLVATEKAASAQGIAFKSDETPDAYPDVVINGVTYKAAPPDLPPANDPVIETKAPGDLPMDDGDGADDEAAEVGDFVGDMTVADFETMIAQLLAPVLKLQDMVKSVGDAHAELKTMYGGVASKDDTRAQELATLKSSLMELQGKIAQIEGDQPATILSAEVEAAFKSEGPASPADPSDVDVPNDPSRPYASLAARTMPSLYRTNADGGFAGWQPPTPT